MREATPRVVNEYPFLYLEHGLLSLDAIGKASGAYIAFKEPVPKARRGEVMRGCPSPIGGMWSWGPTLVSCESMGDTFDWELADHYADGNPDSITDDVVAQFAADVEKWARGVHAKFPILFFIGPVHAEEPSPWGVHSEQALPPLMLQFLEDYAQANKKDVDREIDRDAPETGIFDKTAMACILQHVPEDIEPALLERLRALEKRFPI